jgi:hypothetical protein
VVAESLRPSMAAAQKIARLWKSDWATSGAVETLTKALHRREGEIPRKWRTLERVKDQGSRWRRVVLYSSTYSSQVAQEGPIILN